MLKNLERFLILFALVIFETSNCFQSFSEVPRNTTKKEGEDVMFKCTVKGQRGELVWCKDDSFCTFGRSRNFTDPRYSIVGDERLGEHHLLIRNVSITDNTKYQCQVTATDTVPSIQTEFAFLTVFVEPNSVSIISNNKENTSLVRLTANVSTSIDCVAEALNPGCSILWYLDSSPLKTSAEVSFSPSLTLKLPNKLSKSSGKINIKPAKVSDWYQKQLKCECSNQMTSIYNDKKFEDAKPIVMNYAPIVKIMKISEDDLLPGNFVEFQCIADSEPPAKHFKWYIDSHVYGEGPGERFLYLKITDSMNGKSLKCDAKNDVATGTESYQLQLLFGPKFIQEPPSHLMIKLNEQIALSCDVSSNPTASIMWYLNDSLIYAYPKLVISAVRPDHYGVYKCEAAARDFPKISTTVLVVPPGPPIISADPIQKAYFGYQGTLECLFEKEPKTNDIEWYQGNRRIVSSKDTKYEIKNEIVNRKGTKSILIINDVSQNDFTNYTCRGINSYGLTSKAILLEPQLNDRGSILPITIIFIFVFLACSVIVFLGYSKYFEQDKKKRLRKYRTRQSQFRAKPSFMLNTISHRPVSYAYRMNRHPNTLQKSRRQNSALKNRRLIRLVKDQRQQNRLRLSENRAFRVINPSHLNSQSNLNRSIESLNYFNFEHRQQSSSPRMRNISTPDAYYDEANYDQYINAKFQTDV